MTEPAMHTERRAMAYHMRRNDPSLSVEDIGRALKMTPDLVIESMVRRRTRIDWEKVRQMHVEQGLSGWMIGKLLGHDQFNICHALKRMGVYRPDPRRSRRAA